MRKGVKYTETEGEFRITPGWSWRGTRCCTRSYDCVLAVFCDGSAGTNAAGDTQRWTHVTSCTLQLLWRPGRSRGFCSVRMRMKKSTI